MTRFDHHFKMNEQDCIEYIREKLPDYFGDSDITCKEIGDGNINYVFRLSNGKKTLIVKHADAYTRSGGTPNSTDRSRLEYEILSIQKSYCPDHVPALYAYDPVMCTIAMQDIGDHENMRYGLIKHEIYPLFADHISDFLAETLMRTSGLLLKPAEKREYEKRYVNPVMCSITDRLVFNEPYSNLLHSNIITPGNEQYFEERLYNNEPLKYETALLKEGFQSKRQCLIHGDLHSGSIFVTKDSTMVLDPEFAIMGPGGYDLGNVIAHLFFAYMNAAYTETDEQKKKEFQSWIKKTVTEIYEQFKDKSYSILEECKDPLYGSKQYRTSFISDIIEDSCGYAGTEIIRRIVGNAKVKDLEIGDRRPEAERSLTEAAIQLIMDRRGLTPDNIVTLLDRF